ncbi:hypothetical protein GCM10020331_032210 [Ectobacillus funiculus]
MLRDLFIKKKKKYAAIPSEQMRRDVPDGLMTKCPECKKIMYTKELLKKPKGVCELRLSSSDECMGATRQLTG